MIFSCFLFVKRIIKDNLQLLHIEFLILKDILLLHDLAIKSVTFDPMTKVTHR